MNGRFIVRDLDNPNYPYFMMDDDNMELFHRTGNPLVAHKLYTEEEAKEFARKMGVANYEIEQVK